MKGDGGGGARRWWGLRPEHFEDAAVEDGRSAGRMRFRVKADVVESMGSEKYVYFDVRAQGVHTAELDELAADAGWRICPATAEGQQIVARLSAGAACRRAARSSSRSTPARSSCSPPRRPQPGRPAPDPRHPGAGATPNAPAPLLNRLLRPLRVTAARRGARRLAPGAPGRPPMRRLLRPVRASRPPGAALAGSRPSAPDGRDAPRPSDAGPRAVGFSMGGRGREAAAVGWCAAPP